MSEIEYAGAAISLAVSVTVACLMYGRFLNAMNDLFRQRVFALRDELWLWAHQSPDTRKTASYMRLRQMMNGYVRYCNNLHWPTVLAMLIVKQPIDLESAEDIAIDADRDYADPGERREFLRFATDLRYEVGKRLLRQPSLDSIVIRSYFVGTELVAWLRGTKQQTRAGHIGQRGRVAVAKERGLESLDRTAYAMGTYTPSDPASVLMGSAA